MRAQDVELELTPAAVDRLTQLGHQPECGARPLRRTIQREVDNELSRRLLQGSVRPGERVVVDVEDGRFTFRGGVPEPAGRWDPRWGDRLENDGDPRGQRPRGSSSCWCRSASRLSARGRS
jgi:hypothetical protein